jgi:ABC-type nitrate/sulfonate/bicarbonate transport system substrate-binding protein
MTELRPPSPLRRRLIAAAGLAAAGASHPRPARAARAFRLAVTANPVALPALIAASQDYFAAEGLTVKTVNYKVGRLGLERLLAGEIDFATVADVPIMFESLRRTDFSILAQMTRSSSETVIIARGDRGIVGPSDLRGRRIGAPRASGAHFFVDSYLLYHGLRRHETTFVPLEPDEAAAALARGHVDAAGLFGRLAADALKLLGDRARVLVAPDFFSIKVNIVSAPAVRGISDDDAERLLRAIARANELIARSPGKARAIGAEALGMDVRDVERIWKGYEFKLQLGQPLLSQLESQVRWAQREGLMPPGARVPDYLDLLRPAPLRRVDARAVRLAG